MNVVITQSWSIWLHFVQSAVPRKKKIVSQDPMKWIEAVRQEVRETREILSSQLSHEIFVNKANVSSKG